MPSVPARWTLWIVLAAQAATMLPGHAQALPTAPLPERFEHFLSSVVRPSAAERRRLLGGAAVTKLLDGDPTKFVAVFGAIWINATPRRYVEAVHDIETFERGGSFRVTRRISEPPRLQDFAPLRLSREDVESLDNCRTGDCDLKISEAAMATIRARVNFRAPSAHQDAEAVFRDRMLDLVRQYRAVGNAALPVYHDRPAPTNVADEFRRMVTDMPSITAYLPRLRGYLLDYPRAVLPDASDFLYWQEVTFGLKPTIRISHLVIHEAPHETVVASKMLYASHYFLTALELRVLAADPARGPGFWFITVSSSRIDGLTGFTGFFVRRRVRSEAERGTQTILAATKARLEHPRR